MWDCFLVDWFPFSSLGVASVLFSQGVAFHCQLQIYLTSHLSCSWMIAVRGLTTTTSPRWCMNGNASMMSVFPKPVGMIAKTSDCIHHDITWICSFFNSHTPVWCDIFWITDSTSLAAPAILPNGCSTGYWFMFSLLSVLTLTGYQPKGQGRSAARDQSLYAGPVYLEESTHVMQIMLSGDIISCV